MHFLVIPKVHIASVAGVSAENSAVVAHIFEVIAKLTKEMGRACRICTSMFSPAAT